MLNEDQIYDIQHDVEITNLLEDWLNLQLFADKAMADIIPTDLFYNDNQHAWHILKFLQFLKTDSHITYENLRHQRLWL